MKPLKVGVIEGIVENIQVELQDRNFNFLDIVKQQNILLPVKHKVTITNRDVFGLKYTATNKPIIIKFYFLTSNEVNKTAY